MLSCTLMKSHFSFFWEQTTLKGQMADPGDPADPQPSSSRRGQPQRDEESQFTAAQLSRKRRKVLESVAKKLSDQRLFSHAFVCAVEPSGTTFTYATPAALHQHTRKPEFIQALEAEFDRKPLSKEEKASILAPFGKPPTCKASFQALNNNKLRMLLRCMRFCELQSTFRESSEESWPRHMQTCSNSYVFLGNFLDQDALGKVSDHKFQGKSKKDGRFQAQEIPDSILCQKQSMWVSGECPEQDNPAYTTFDAIMSTNIKEMTRPMLIIAIGIQLECLHPGIFHTYKWNGCTCTDIHITQNSQACTCASTHAHA